MRYEVIPHSAGWAVVQGTRLVEVFSSRSAAVTCAAALNNPEVQYMEEVRS